MASNVTTVDGHVPNYINPETRVPSLLGVHISLTVLALLVVLLRLYTRKAIRGIFSIEEWITAAAMILALVSSICSCLSVLGGTGLHYYDIQPTVNKGLAASLSFVNQVLYQPTLQLTKISILLFYMSTLGKSVRATSLALIALSVLLCIACTIVEFLQCKPVDMLWNGTHPNGYKCIKQQKFFFVSGIINLILDLATLIVPLPVLWGLNAPIRSRIALCLVFSVGLVTITAEVARIVIWGGIKDGNRTSPDATWNRVTIVNWSCVEYCAGIICASLPHLKPLIAKLLPGFFESIIQSSKGGSKAFNSKGNPFSQTHTSDSHALHVLSHGKSDHGNTSHISSMDRRTATRLTDNDSEEYILEAQRMGNAIVKTTEWRTE